MSDWNEWEMNEFKKINKMQSKQKYVLAFNAFLAETNKILFLV